MDEKFAIKLFDEYKIRTKWDPEIEDYYYSVIDVIAVLTESKNPNRYWSDLKRKLSEESGQPYENIVRLKLKPLMVKCVKLMLLTPNNYYV